MKVKFSPWLFTIAFCLIVCARVSDAQSCPTGMTCLQLFGAVNGAQSLANASFATTGPTGPYAFNTTTLNLTCPASGIVATLSGPYTTAGVVPTTPFQPGGNLLVDNDIIVTVTPSPGNLNIPGSFSSTPTNICTGGLDNGGYGASYGGNPIPFVPTNLSPNCFGSGYSSNYTSLNLQDPDTFLAPGGSTFDYAGGVAPLNLVYPIAVEALPSEYTSQAPAPTGLIPGAQQITIAPTDEGGVVTSSTIFLTTNCVQGPVTGPAQVSGNPVTDNTLSQSLTFNPSSTNGVTLVYDLTKANAANTLTIPGTSTSPIGGDLPVDPTQFQTVYVPSTSFATSNCILHSGEALQATPNIPACKLYTLECTQGALAPSGANCPVSTQANEVIEDLFDGPQFRLRDIFTPYGVVHEGIGLLMAADGWASYNAETNPEGLTGGPCAFSSASNLETLPCPQNLLISFSGPGGFGGVAQTTNPNSTFISVYGVPEDLTSVSVKNEYPDHWNKTHTPTVYFSSQTPNLSKGAYTLVGGVVTPLPNAPNYIPAPIQGITYGITSAGSPLPLPINEPITTDATQFYAGNDQVVPNPALGSGCPVPTAGSPGPKVQPNFPVTAVPLPSLPDGEYLIHYFAQDCAGTQELLFTQDPSTSWSTNFYVHPINIDTTPPQILGLALSQGVSTYSTGATFKVGSTAYATYSCTDAPSGAGVILCGTKQYAHETTYATPTLKTQLNTSKAGGPFTFTVVAQDGAGNPATPQQIQYSVSSR